MTTPAKIENAGGKSQRETEIEVILFAKTKTSKAKRSFYCSSRLVHTGLPHSIVLAFVSPPNASHKSD
jgi:hypothetical protein